MAMLLPSIFFTPESHIPFVEPQAWHRVEALSDDLECTLGFYCKKKKIISVKKYNMTAIHGDVVDAAKLSRLVKY